MAKTLKYIFLILLIGALVFGIWKFRTLFSSPPTYIEQNSQILLERMEKVNKLITVDAYFSELYDYKDYYYYDFSMFRKKALIRIKAKVSVGYDFEKISIETNDETKTIYIKDFPKPEILSVDHDLDYYDLSEGTFNSFSEEDHNKINKNAKDFIKEKAAESDIFDESEQQKEELIEMFQWMIQTSGWKLQVGDSESVKIPLAG